MARVGPHLSLPATTAAGAVVVAALAVAATGVTAHYYAVDAVNPASGESSATVTTKGVYHQGMPKQSPYTCSYTVAKRYDCHVETQAPCKKPIWRSYSCDKWSWGWVANGCERAVKKAYGCIKEVAGKCTKERDVTVACEVTKKVACKKAVRAPCDKTYRKAVTCAKAHNYGYDGKPCYEEISYKGTCTTEQDTQCEVKSKGLCKKTQTYVVSCVKKEWSADGCTREVTEKYGCMKNTKSTSKCWYKEPPAETTCVVKKWVKDGCRKMVRHTGQCMAWTWEPNCCAHSEMVHTCKDKWCPVTECEATAGAAGSPTPSALAKVTVSPTPTATPYKARSSDTATIAPKRTAALKWTAPYKAWSTPPATEAPKWTAAPYNSWATQAAIEAPTSDYYR
ncbi:hypothetical protein MMPV_007067 [Pyropia vietnamensis]